LRAGPSGWQPSGAPCGGHRPAAPLPDL
jgi:hypothetical protein